MKKEQAMTILGAGVQRALKELYGGNVTFSLIIFSSDGTADHVTNGKDDGDDVIAALRAVADDLEAINSMPPVIGQA
ncbi:hypothetical protein Deba_1603 [Desulfarculus baarsii DSM 2075]|uniref:Uncharacterized protein n=1 Tax=Desulfarculus baarsii (strain ATCC 33931 / DSM 2075 / LMG 7858 / VKM B-1802 / 2st14) TaxID=644282 RepID=E1QHC8_DESB2|nr:hypothetical protein [Desulfarculus baarsii]ADK84971.1 hypothetical protein Deba_1603 [Desulfarculus baarsii DSM 2075]